MRPRGVLLLATGWILVGILAGSLEHITLPGPPAGRWRDAVGAPLLASIIWIPLTLGAIQAARRWRWAPATRWRTLGLHAVLSVAASFLLNLCFFSVAVVVGTAPSAAGFAESVVSASLRYLHLNAGTYWVAVVGTWLVSRTREAESVAATRVDPPATLSVRTGGKVVLVPVADIDWIEGAGDYARLHVGGRDYLLGQRLKVLAERLDSRHFARVHRSAIVNLSRVRELRHRSHGDYDAVLEGGTAVRVSRSRRRSIERLLDRGSSREPTDS